MRVTSFIISWMLTALITLLATLSSIFRSRAALELENLALRHQIGVLRRAASKRLKLTSADRLLWICLSRLFTLRKQQSTLDLTSQDPVLCPKIFVPQQQFLIDRSGDVGHHARPKHFGFPLDSKPQ